MTIQWNKDDLFYVCTMIEYVSRKTHNKSKDVVVRMSDNHCLSFEQVADEWIEDYGIPNGNYDNISKCRYEVPTVTAIGRVYQTLISEVAFLYQDIVEAIKMVYSSFISDVISDYNSSVYYSNPDYIRCSYEAGKLLD